MTFSKSTLTKFAFYTSMVLAAAACGGDDDDGGDVVGADASTTEEVDAAVEENPAMPALGTQIDRAGRPAISTALVETFNGDSAAKGAARDAYNAAGPGEWASFAPDFVGSLAILDALDATCGNQLLADDGNVDGRYAALAGILADDQLYVNSASGECGVYLGLEAEIVGAVPAGDGKCGGRTPADDIIDRSYSVLAAGILTGVDDTVAADDCAPSDAFPFLCDPAS